MMKLTFTIPIPYFTAWCFKIYLSTALTRQAGNDGLVTTHFLHIGYHSMDTPVHHIFTSTFTFFWITLRLFQVSYLKEKGDE